MVHQQNTNVGMANDPPHSLFGWSPSRLPADTPAKRRADRLLPATGLAMTLYFAGVISLLVFAPLFTLRAGLALDGLAALAAATWCGTNFWRCRHAHCVVTAIGWFMLSIFSFVEAGLGRSLIAGHEQPIFLAILIIGLIFEAIWVLVRGTNACIKRESHIK